MQLNLYKIITRIVAVLLPMLDTKLPILNNNKKHSSNCSFVQEIKLTFSVIFATGRFLYLPNFMAVPLVAALHMSVFCGFLKFNGLHKIFDLYHQGKML